MTPLPSNERARIRPWLVVLIWALYGVVSLNQSVVYAQINNRPTEWPRLLAFVVCICVPWLIFTPLIIWMGRRFPLQQQGWQRYLPLHIALALVLAAIDVKIDRTVMPNFGGVIPPNYWSGYISQLDFNIFYYLVILASVTAADMFVMFRERHRKATELHAELVTAKLESLKMQLQPHFLFNTLNAIGALIHEDTEAADRMVTRLADLLRLTLYETRQEVPLARELEFISAYVEIQQIRFHNRLRVNFEVNGALLGAQVPSLVLQPLVENAIRHGIAPRRKAGRVWIRARREGNQLILEVQDDGVGLEKVVHKLGGGIGLQNTRARLQQLYGDAAYIDMTPATEGGTLVTVRLPYVECSAEPQRDGTPNLALVG